MDQNEIEKAFERLSRHNDALMLQIAEYEKRDRCLKLRCIVWDILKARFRAFLGKE